MIAVIVFLVSASVWSVSSTTPKPVPLKEDWWYQDAIKDIAYQLRSHKFNEFDRRFNKNGDKVPRTYFQAFPKPPLRTLHWEVNRFCEESFYKCLEYLKIKLKQVALQRQDDPVMIAQENHLNNSAIQHLNEDCEKLKKTDEEVADPFEGPLERYQWRTTASYFMCWYTMNELPELEHINDHCDNFAYCYDESIGLHNKDVRAIDNNPFACALYSFCPDSCYPVKLLRKFEDGYMENPCSIDNHPQACILNRADNTDFSDLILNRWNVSCHCEKTGFVWSSLYGICVDVDECSQNVECAGTGESCLNLKGSFRCICKWGYTFEEITGKCIINDDVALIKLESNSKEKKDKSKSAWKEFLGMAMKIIGQKSKNGSMKLMQLDKVMFVIVNLISFLNISPYS